MIEEQKGTEGLVPCRSSNVFLDGQVGEKGFDLGSARFGRVTTTRMIQERWPQVQVIALTSFQEKELVQDALAAGAISYLLKNVSMDDLTEAVRASHARRATLAQRASQALIRAVSQGPTPGHDLAPREVLVLLVEGLNNPGTSERLCISLGTTRSNVSNVLSQLGVSNRGEAIALARRHNLVT